MQVWEHDQLQLIFAAGGDCLIKIRITFAIQEPETAVSEYFLCSGDVVESISSYYMG